ncbi:MAG: hypothetical protein E7448_08790 [Ruminococcaceae bacterium]|nr:hypothetical protein [Oscillospiraceae bacterium]
MKNLNNNRESFKLKYASFLTGCDAIEDQDLWDKEALGEMEAFYANDLTGVIIRLIASDGKITQSEVAYLNEAFGFDYTVEELTELYDTCKEDIDRSFDENFENGITYMRKINPKLADAYKELLFLVCEIIIDSDGIIAVPEISEVVRLRILLES